MQMIPVNSATELSSNLGAIAATVSSVTGTTVTADDLHKIGDNLYAAPADYGDQAVELLSRERTYQEPPAGYTTAPRLDTYRFIPKDGSPNALLERLPLKEALEKVTREHRKIADWIRAQRGRPGWDLDRPTREMWPYIHASKRLKLCRIQLEEMWNDVIADHGDDNSDWASAQAEADALSARSMAEKVRSGWPGGGMHA